MFEIFYINTVQPDTTIFPDLEPEPGPGPEIGPEPDGEEPEPGGEEPETIPEGEEIGEQPPIGPSPLNPDGNYYPIGPPNEQPMEPENEGGFEGNGSIRRRSQNFFSSNNKHSMNHNRNRQTNRNNNNHYQKGQNRNSYRKRKRKPSKRRHNSYKNHHGNTFGQQRKPAMATIESFAS